MSYGFLIINISRLKEFDSELTPDGNLYGLFTTNGKGGFRYIMNGPYLKVRQRLIRITRSLDYAIMEYLGDGSWHPIFSRKDRYLTKLQYFSFDKLRLPTS